MGTLRRVKDAYLYISRTRRRYLLFSRVPYASTFFFPCFGLIRQDGNEHVKKLSYYFEVVNNDESSNIRSGDISFSLYPHRGGGLMKYASLDPFSFFLVFFFPISYVYSNTIRGERRMIRNQLISESNGFLTEKGELILRLHLYTKTLINIVNS
jgi:hypothetical protein